VFSTALCAFKTSDRRGGGCHAVWFVLVQRLRTNACQNKFLKNDRMSEFLAGKRKTAIIQPRVFLGIRAKIQTAKWKFKKRNINRTEGTEK